MFNTSGYNLSDIAAVTRGEDGFFGGNNGWWIILLFLFAFGGGGWGFGDNRGIIPATQSDVRAANDQQTLISKLDQQTYGLADGVYTLNNSLMNGFHGVDNAICTLGYQNQQGFNTLGYQLSNCCCETQRLMERGFCDTNNAINNSTRQILDFLTQDKIATLTAENQNLKFAASQCAQNAYLINELRPNPIPAYTVASPYAAYPVASGCCNF